MLSAFVRFSPYLTLGGLLTLLSAALAVGEQPAENIVAYNDLAYVEGGADRQKLDLYLPASESPPHALIVWIHGGGFRGGSKRDCLPLREGFVKRGYAVASIDYRLSQGALFPAQIDDCRAAIRWLRAHADRYNLDPARFGVWGGSAGGMLAALLGTMDDSPVSESPAKPPIVSSAVQAVVDFYGPTDFRQMDAHAIVGARLVHDDADSPESQLIGGPIQAPENAARVREASPLTYVTEDDPPFLLAHGTADPKVPYHQSELLYEALLTKGVPVQFVTVRGALHGRDFPHSLLTPVVAEFFARYLNNRQTTEPPPASHLWFDAPDS